MLTLSTELYKKFISQTGGILPSPIYPEVNYIKVVAVAGKITFSKTNLHTYCQMVFEVSNLMHLEVLLEEKSVTTFVNLYAGETFNVDVIDDSVVISNGKNKISFAHMTTSKVPAFPVPESEAWYYIDREHMDAVKSASQCIKVTGNPTLLHFVHLNGDGIFGSTGSFAYYRKSDQHWPGVVLSAKSCEVLDYFQDAPGVEFNINPSFNFVRRDNITYAMLGVEFKTFDYKKFFDGDGDKMGEFKKIDLEKFCSAITSLSDSMVAIGEIRSVHDMMAVARFNDSAFNKKVEAYFDSENFNDFTFTFLVNDLQKYIRALPYETLRLSSREGNYRVTTKEDEKFIGIIQMVQNH